jgi:hypothetical protein
MLKNKVLYFWLIFLTIIFTLGSGVDKRDVDTATDQILFESQRNQALSITGGFDAIGDTVITVNSGSAWTYPNPDMSVIKKIPIVLKSGTFLRGIVFNTNADVWFKLVGSGIYAKTSGVDSTTVFPLRSGKSITLEINNLSAIHFYGNGSTDATVDLMVLAARNKDNTPAN